MPVSGGGVGVSCGDECEKSGRDRCVGMVRALMHDREWRGKGGNNGARVGATTYTHL